ncbi:MAG TPA: LysM domain-containing protein, partial [Kofleriaceae bacterium]|nr:LysM domain-containing protein [Kofleriaceae bacterium]
QPMTSPPYRLHAPGALALAAALLLPAAAARAQVPTVTPDGKLADPAAPPAPAQGQEPATIVVQPDGTAQPAGAEPAAPAGETGTGFYHTDDYGGLIDETVTGGPGGPVQVHGGAVPPAHTVRRGDTLWDISWLYFNSPWEWPRVWSYNPEITNPHWIYPGDQVRLHAAGQAPAAAPLPGEPSARAATTSEPVAAARPRSSGEIELRQLGFVASEDLKLAIEITGSTEEKLLLSTGDEVYLSYPNERPPKVGQRYSIYEEKRRIKHPREGHEVGAYVKIVGELEVISVMKDKVARAVILDSVDAVERGMQVGPLVRQFKDVEPVPATRDLEGTIVAQLQAEALIGARQVVFIDRGASHGVKVGNQMHVVRRGDAYEAVGTTSASTGKNDPRYPARSLGEIIILQTGKQTSVALVTRSEREFGIGDRVLMVRARGGGS